MRKLVLIGTALVIFGAVGLAAPGCLVGGQTVAALGATGCTIGTATFSNFSITGSNVIGGASANAIDPTLLKVTITDPGTSATVLLAPNAPSDWSVTTFQQFSFVLNYTLTDTGVTAYVSYQSMINFNSQVGTGGASLVKTVSVGGTGATGADQTNPAGSPMAFSPNEFTFSVVDNIQANGGSAGSINLTSVNNFFKNASAVPEPATSAMVGIGILGLCLLRRRFRA